MKRAAMLRLWMIGAGLASASVCAEPPSRATHAPATADRRSGHVQLASADHASKGSAASAATESGARKPAARVTTCRCADQLVDSSDDPAEEPQD